MGKTQTRGGARKPYTPEFREKALAALEKGTAEGRTATDVAKDLGIHVSNLYVWGSNTRLKGHPTGKGSGKGKRKLNGHAKPSHAIVRATFEPAATGEQALRAEIALLKQEVDILTQTVMIFARRRS